MYPPRTLHHYTSGAGLLGIVESSAIWATQIQYMNDYKEFSHAIDLARTELFHLKKRENDSAVDKICDKVFELLDSMSGVSIYVACFSEVDDSLSQWRGYCPSGFGYCIGFVEERLKQIAESQGFTLKPCIYDLGEQRKLVKKWTEGIVSQIKENYFEDIDLEQYCSTHAQEYFNEFARLAPYVKHNSFFEEKEWRLVTLVFSNDPRVKLRAGRSMLVPYIEIDLKLSRETDLVWNIRVGPTPQLELAMSSATKLFNKINIVSGIGRTMVPYRDW